MSDNFERMPIILQNYLKNISVKRSDNYLIIKTTNIFNIKSAKNLRLCVNLEKTNNLRHVNKFHESVNIALVNEGIYCSCAETLIQRKSRKWKKSRYYLGPFILFIDFIYKRVIPKLPLFKNVYFTLTRGYNRVMSQTEIYGRLVSCGFEILDILEEGSLTYLISKKVREPYFDMDPSYGPIFKMKRVGYKGKIINVYKFRTMSPYSEYVQNHVININKLNKRGKIKDDYRITFYGKFLRKYWVDELPMIINWLKRDLKFVGVRPLSEDYFSRYPKDLQNLRVQTRPGLVPPYYVDLPISFKEICDSERSYLTQYLNNPYKTDFKYLFMAFWNIFIKGTRSR